MYYRFYNENVKSILLETAYEASRIILGFVRNSEIKRLTKTTAAQNGFALSYHKVREIYFLAVVFAASIV